MNRPYYFVTLFVALIFANTPVTAQTLRDCTECPTMVTLPSGKFLMGTSISEITREKIAYKVAQPQHLVTIRSFALGQNSVTRGEFALFVKETGNDPRGCYFDRKKQEGLSWRNPGFAQNDQHPVVCVSYEDAQLYVQWLSKKTNKPYRLPTEAEWEYAARGGTNTTRYWGDGRERTCEFANVSDFTGADSLKRDKNKDDQVFQCQDGYVYTAPVRSFPPNPFGLFDMLGNVGQWTEDCYNDSYQGAPTDGSAWRSGDCGHRVLRGASWASVPGFVRSAHRDWDVPSFRGSFYGFRVAKTLGP